MDVAELEINDIHRTADSPRSSDVVIARLDIPFTNILGHTCKILLAMIIAPIILSPVIAIAVAFIFEVLASIGAN